MITMKAVALTQYLPISDPHSLMDVELPRPIAQGRDLLVKIQAVSVNPVDAKIRSPKPKVESSPKILGWDAAGIVENVGPEVRLFKPGEEVYFAGSVTRPGSNAEFQLVDERLVGRKPANLSFAEAAAMPLTLLTAWEALFERIGIDRMADNRGQSLLIIGGAGGVGSIAIQLAKLAGLTVIVTASRPETRAWAEKMGADQVIDHRQPLPGQLAALSHKEVDYIANFSNTDSYWAVMAELIRPQGRIVCIVENAHPVELGLLKSKSASFSWTFMFTRSMFQTPDMGEQGGILDDAAKLFEAGRLQTTLTETLSPINAANMRDAHAQIESGKTIGKLVIAEWP
jgi:zinc-binding alcohol dehydrogenase family protein